MSGSATVRPGNTVQLPLTVDGDLSSGPTYTLSDPSLGTLKADDPALEGAVFVAGSNKGVATVTAAGVGVTNLTDSVEITISPLAQTLTLSIGTIS